MGGARFYKRNLRLYKLYAKKNPHLDPRYIFINSGFNLRPTDIQGAIAHNQFKRLNSLMRQRNQNRNIIIKTLVSSKSGIINLSSLIHPTISSLVGWVFQSYYPRDLKIKKRFVNYLDSKGIETRPIISGNFLNQPAAKLYKLNKEKRSYPNTQAVQELGFLIGLHTKKIDEIKLKLIHDAFFKIDSI